MHDICLIFGQSDKAILILIPFSRESLNDNYNVGLIPVFSPCVTHSLSPRVHLICPVPVSLPTRSPPPLYRSNHTAPWCVLMSFLPLLAGCTLELTVVVTGCVAFFSPKLISRVPLLSTAAADGPRFSTVIFQLGLSTSGVLIAQTGFLLHAVTLAALDDSEEFFGVGEIALSIFSFLVHSLLFPLCGILVALVGLVNYDETEALAHAALTTSGVFFATLSCTISTIVLAIVLGPRLLPLKVMALVLLYGGSGAFYSLYAKAHEHVPPDKVGLGERAFQVVQLSDSQNDDMHESSERGAAIEIGNNEMGDLIIIIPPALTWAALFEYVSITGYAIFLASATADTWGVSLDIDS